ncbi:MAG: uncharacterized protein QOI48_3008 [Solirubrobacteraceae bacterium]|jgi:predicted extracellular nuclease|nr:uncharacterized protein [Solirubrobacteraceae bacterium]
MTVSSTTHGQRRVPFAVAVLGVACAVCVAFGLGTAPVHADSPQVANRLHGGGVSAGATPTHDDVELHNHGAAGVGGWVGSVRYVAAPADDAGVPAAGVAPRIRDIQGRAHVSPLLGQRVLDVRGVVTAVLSNRFFMQDPQPDGDRATSEALVVFTGSGPGVAVGDAVTVAGTVQEFRPGGAGATNLTTTQISSPTVLVASSDNPLPAATLVGPDGRAAPTTVIDDDANGSVETSGSFDADEDGIDFWESMEAMRVQIDDPQVVGPTNAFGAAAVVPAGAGPRTNRGGIVISAQDFNPERVVLAGTLAAIPAANVGDSYAGAVTGVLDYAFGLFTLLPATSPELRGGALAPEATRRPRKGELAVATFNVENLSVLDAPEKYAALATQIVRNLADPDIVALEEIQDDSGAANDGVVAADRTLQTLVDAIRAQGGPPYRWRQINPVDGQDGGQPGGNIRQALLFRSDRGLSFVDRPGGDANTPVAVLAQRRGPRLSISPGRIDPANPAFTTSRKPLVGEFRFDGERIFVVANHFNSKGGDQPLFGRFQPPASPSEVQRHAQATVVRALTDALLASDPRAKIVVLGDLNDFEFSTTADILVGENGSLVDLPRTLPVGERYTFVFEGNSQVLDHILISRALADSRGHRRAYEYDIVHTNSEFTNQLSDHDPQVARLKLDD